VVRDATVDDVHAIADVHVRAWQAAYRGFLPAQFLDGLSVALREASWHTALRDDGPQTLILVAEDPPGSVIGFCCLALPSRDDDAGEHTVEIAATYVTPPRWDSGVGRALLMAAFDRLRGGDWADATLWVFRRNAHGRAFYARLGFRLDGTMGVHEPSGAVTARMRASLPAS